jgi:hypothetical protein
VSSFVGSGLSQPALRSSFVAARFFFHKEIVTFAATKSAHLPFVLPHAAVTNRQGSALPSSILDPTPELSSLYLIGIRFKTIKTKGSTCPVVIASHFMFYPTSYRTYSTFISVPPFHTRTMKEQECV